MHVTSKPGVNLDEEYRRFQREIQELTAASPPRYPKKVVFETPDSIRKGAEVIEASDPKEGLTPGRTATVQVALRVLTDLDDVLTVAKYAKRYRQGLVGAVKLDSPEAVEALHGYVEGAGSGWVRGIVGQTKSLLGDDYTGIRLKHLERFEGKKGGFHFCPVGHRERPSIAVIAKNEETGVWIGKYKEKNSSFFPDFINSREDLTSLLLSKRRIASYSAKGKTKQLSMVIKKDVSFYVLDYRREDVSLLTAFPLFFVKYLSELGDDIVVPGICSLKKADVQRYFLETEKPLLHRKIEISISDSLHLIRVDGEFGIPEGVGVYFFVTSAEMKYTPVWS